MTAGFWQSALRELQRFFRSPRFWLTAVTVALLFTVTGPFGTMTSMPVLQRLCFWLLLLCGAFVVAGVCAVLSDLVLQAHLPVKLLRIVTGSLVAALPIGLYVALLQAGFTGQPITLSEILGETIISLPLCLIFCLLSYMTLSGTTSAAAGPPRSEHAQAAPSSDTGPAPVVMRLRADQRGALLRLSVQDHYTDVVTTKGRDLLLLRFSDALGEIGATPGQRIHRSHWVADAHVRGLKRDRGKLFVLTGDGQRLPVSRPYEADVRARFPAMAKAPSMERDDA